MKLEELKLKNKGLVFLTSDDASPLFKRVEGAFDDIIALSAKLSISAENKYIADDESAAGLESVVKIGKEVFAELPIQSGWCFGGNRYMNGMEWHKSSEAVVACTDCILLLGAYGDIICDEYDSSKSIALYLKKGEAAELLPMTLHLAPLPVEETFKIAVILPKGTNLPLTDGIKGTRRAVNKWLLVHKDNIKGIENGGKIGVTGENIFLNG